MNVSESIQSLTDLIGRAGESWPAVSESSICALRAISASSARAQLQEKRLSASARMTVASSAMAFVVQALDPGREHPGLARLLARIAEEARALAPAMEFPHERGSDAACPNGWHGDMGGPFSRHLPDGTILTIVRRRLLPGGEWSVFFGPVPAAFGATVEGAANMALDLIDVLAGGQIDSKRPLPSVRRPQLART